MSVETVDTFTPWLKGILEELEKLSRAEIRVGILAKAGGELLKIAHVHEFGATITPKSAKNLAIPLKPQCKNKSPRDFQNTWILEDDGNRFIVRNKAMGEGDDDIDFLYMLVPKVTIPERSFIRAGYDANKGALAAVCDEAFGKVLLGELTAKQACDQIGLQAVALIREYMDSITPPKSRITLASSPGKTTPLVQSGRLRKAITFEVTGI